jgi:hypothetical protein
VRILRSQVEALIAPESRRRRRHHHLDERWIIDTARGVGSFEAKVAPRIGVAVVIQVPMTGLATISSLLSVRD